ncbi:DNA methylase [Vibrio jasicida]|jgi:tRNA G10  N-methylase Trm11|uniref:TRM11 family SAM-dependent methyltransferase n=1 Tax=Vibrio TaxID=662 RepID=UPI0005EF19B2|nr:MULTISPECIES: DNA methylase [Vibrio]MCF6451836.1 DNA methylase [Vibrio sp. MMG023]CAH1544501.1 DNA methylase [Vibrio jasicida]CAH1606047.1 DNA methylase [Vibrio jasicida]
MYHYAILANPGHNRIYFDSAMTIACSELKAILASEGVEVTEIGNKDVGLPAALVFSCEDALNDQQSGKIAASSIYYALFEVREDGLLRPIQAPAFNTFPESMSQILRYTGKTNEQFTRLMVNLGVSASNTDSAQLTLMDPMCGKGTTLFEGLIHGLNVVGVEINQKWVQEIQTFIVKFMKNGRFKHKVSKEKRTSGGKKVADGFVVEAASEKEEYNKGNLQTMKLYSADTRIADQVVKKNSVDVMVSDLPYGVQHGSKNAKDSKLNRSPLELLQEALPAWKVVLKKQGSVVLSFNEFTLKWKDVAALFEEQGWKVLSEEPYIGYLHRVDQSINRNIIVAIKP